MLSATVTPEHVSEKTEIQQSGREAVRHRQRTVGVTDSEPRMECRQRPRMRPASALTDLGFAAGGFEDSKDTTMFILSI